MGRLDIGWKMIFDSELKAFNKGFKSSMVSREGLYLYVFLKYLKIGVKRHKSLYLGLY